MKASVAKWRMTCFKKESLQVLYQTRFGVVFLDDFAEINENPPLKSQSFGHWVYDIHKFKC
jgi:hypothetical protein